MRSTYCEFSRPAAVGNSPTIWSNRAFNRATTSRCCAATLCCSAGSFSRSNRLIARGRVAGAQAGILGRLGLLVGCEDRHAVGRARVDPAPAGCVARAFAGRQHVQLPAGVAHRRQRGPCWPKMTS